MPSCTSLISYRPMVKDPDDPFNLDEFEEELSYPELDPERDFTFGRTEFEDEDADEEDDYE